jgi:hypothetical protein
MMMTTNVKGTLTPTKSTAVTENIADIILMAFTRHELLWAVSEDIGINGIIQVNDSLTTKDGNFPTSATVKDKAWHRVWGVIERLEDILETEGVKELAMNGSVLVTVENDTEPLLVLLTVEKGIIYYQEATLTWNSKILY